MSAAGPPAKRPSAPAPPDNHQHPPRRLDTCVVPFLLAEPTSAGRSVFDALKLVLRQKNDPRSSMFKPTARAPPPPMLNTHVYVQEKFDGHRQHVSVASDGSVSVHGKETAELETIDDSFLETLSAELAQLPRPCLLDGEIVAWNADGHVTLDLVKPARGGTHRRWAVVLFDITCAQVESADYETRHALLDAVLGSTPGPLDDAQRVALNRHVIVAPNLATWTTATTPQACADVGRRAIESGLEGLVLRGAQQGWTARAPGSTARVPSYVAMKLKPDHLAHHSCTLLAVGVSSTWKLVLWQTGASRVVGKADLLTSASDVNRELWQSIEFSRGSLDDASWTPPKGLREAAPTTRIWFKQPFPVQVLCDWRLVPSGVKFARVVGRGKTSDVPASYTELATQLRASALVAFTAIPMPPLPPQAVAGRSPAEMEARRVLSMAARPPLPRLLEQSLEQLKLLAAQRYLTKSGTKTELVRRLFASRWPVLRIMLDERPESAVVAQAVALARQLGIVAEKGEPLEWALIRQRGGTCVDWEGDANGAPNVLVTDSPDPVAERAAWGLDQTTRVVPFSWLSMWSQQDVDLPDTYDEAARVGEGGPPRLTPAV